MGNSEIYQTKGFFLLKGFFGQERISELAEIIDPIFKLWVEKSKSEIIEHKILNMHSLTHEAYFHKRPGERVRFFNSLLPPQLTNLLDGIFGEGLYFHNTQLFFNPDDKTQLPLLAPGPSVLPY